MAKEPTTVSSVPFDWMGSRVRATPQNTAQTRDAEITARAGLLARLGVPKKQAEKRLKALVSWEHEQLGKALVQKRLAALVAHAYKRAGK
jgi:hypothetical protein